ncbi:hypothetical protein CIB48_g7633 [Xylaria polymorpha]|nr:hypothetical protein CIB48_g7633 [Xylaria polymorpha]
MSPLSVEGKFAIVTGGGSGINLAFSKLLLQHGCSVVIVDLALRPEAKELASQYSHKKGGTGLSAIFLQTDISSCPGPVSSSPISRPSGTRPRRPQTRTAPSIDSANGEPGSYKCLEINLTRPIRLSQLGIGYWTKNKLPGTLVHVSSIAGHVAGVAAPLYFASKHGCMLRDTAGIRVSAVAPGTVKTPLWTEAPDKKHLVENDGDLEILPETVAEAMSELCENPEYGNGMILEVMNDHRRVVSLFNADPPPPKAADMPAFVTITTELLERRLKKDGLDV